MRNIIRSIAMFGESALIAVIFMIALHFADVHIVKTHIVHYLLASLFLGPIASAAVFVGLFWYLYDYEHPSNFQASLERLRNQSAPNNDNYRQSL